MSQTSAGRFYEAGDTTGWRCEHQHQLLSSAASCALGVSNARIRQWGEDALCAAVLDPDGMVVLPPQIVPRYLNAMSERLRLIGGPFDLQYAAPPTAGGHSLLIAHPDKAGELHMYAWCDSYTARYVGRIRAELRTAELA